MIGAPFFDLAAKSLWNRRGTAALTILAIALSVMLFVGVEKIRTGARASFDHTISGTDVIVGARSGSINLLLYTVFRLGEPVNNISWASYRTFAVRREVKWTIPISLGDSHRGFRVLGTDHNYYEHYRYGRDRPLAFRDGAATGDVFSVVLGSQVAEDLHYRVGDAIVISHGIGRTSFMQHKDKPFTVSGILKPTGTPVDRTVHVTLAGIEAIHENWPGGGRAPPAARGHHEHEETGHEDPHDDDHADDGEEHHHDHKAGQITAFLVGLRSPVAALQLQRDVNQYTEEPLSAILPGVTLRQLWGIAGVAERALAVTAGFVIFIGLVGMLTSILTGLRERRREMAILRAVGARPWHIFALLMCEAGLLAFIGSVLGLVLVYAGLAGVGPWAEARTGLALGFAPPGAFDLGIVAAVVGAAFAMGAYPAALAYRRSLADGLTVKT